MNSNAPSKKQIVRQFIRLTLISGVIFVFVGSVLLILLSWYHRDSVKKFLFEHLQQELQTAFYVEDVELSMLRSFPLATLSFTNAVIYEAEAENKSNTLIHARSIKLQFNIVDIFRKNYLIRQIVIKDGALHPQISDDGAANYMLPRPKNGQHDKQMQFDIRRLLLEDVHISFIDQRSGNMLSCDVINIRLSGSFSGAAGVVKVRGKLHLNELLINHTSYLGDNDLDINLDLEVSNESGWHLHRSRLTLDGHSFELNGVGSERDGKQYVDMNIKAKQLPVVEFAAYLPVSARNILSSYEPAGKLSLDGRVTGKLQANQLPQITAGFSIRNGSVNIPQNQARLHRIMATGTYTNGDNRGKSSSELILSTFTARSHSGHSHLEGAAGIRNFNQPNITLNLAAESKADELLQWLNIKHVSNASGNTHFNISFSGMMQNGNTFTGKDLVNATLSGMVSFEDVKFILNDNLLLPYRDFNGKMVLNDNLMVIEQLSGKAGSSDFHFGGNIKNLLPYLFIPNEAIMMEAIMHADYINLDELLQYSQHGGDTVYMLKFSDKLRLDMDASVEKLHFRRFEAQKVNGSLRLDRQILDADHLSFNTMQGNVEMQGRIDATRDKDIGLQTQAQLVGVDINQLFYQLGNFGQSGITSDHLSGRLTAGIVLSALWTKALEINWESLETSAKIKVEDGRLQNFPPMMTLGRFIRTDDLDNIRFSTLENEIQINNMQVVIPMMSVNTNVIDLHLSGNHGFTNEIDYRMRVLLSELLSDKHRKSRNPQSQYGEIIDDGLGRTTLFLRLSGTVQDPVLRYDHEGAWEKLRDDLRNERDNLRDIMRDEFRFLLRQPEDTAATKPNARKKERERIRQQEQGEFIIEWD